MLSWTLTRNTACNALMAMAVAMGLGGKAVACPFLENVAQVIPGELRSLAADQWVEISGLEGMPDIHATFRYLNEAGPPRVSRQGEGALILMPRQYILDVYLWADHLAACETDRAVCARTADYLRWFQASYELGEGSFEPLVRDGPDRSCPTRGTPEFADTWGGYATASMLFIQMHELAHVILGDIDVDYTDTQFREGRADGFATVIFDELAGIDGLFQYRAAAAILPLVRPVYLSADYPDPVCRVAVLGLDVGLVGFDERPDCPVYMEGVSEGRSRALAMIGDETDINSGPE